MLQKTIIWQKHLCLSAFRSGLININNETAKHLAWGMIHYFLSKNLSIKIIATISSMARGGVRIPSGIKR
jgi:hypothetical protein